MPPITRSSVHGRGEGPSFFSQSQVQMAETDGDFDNMDDQESDHGDDPFREGSEGGSPFRSAQDMLLPLQETANRVSRQVEDFAKALDKFKSDREISDQELWNEAVELLKTYVSYTENRIKQSAARGRSSIGENESQASVLKLESNLWTLVENLLLCKGPEAISWAEETLNRHIKELHRYSTDTELWEKFLDGDVVAQEYETILDWLQEAASESAPKLEQVVAGLTAKSDRGDGIWSAGLIYTKDAIKKQKRSRAWPMPLDPSNPGLRSTHFRDNDDATLVTQMDPDAPTREKAKLVELDEFHEEAAWRICWEMLRRGMKMQDIQSWWSDRKESWRTALLQGSSGQQDQLIESPWLRIINLASSSEYMERCRLVSSKDSERSEYEEAVFGILCGNHTAATAACDGLDDVLYSYFNAVLIERWKQFLAAHRRIVQDPEAAPFRPAASSISVIREFLAAAEVHEATRDEFQQPHKFIEAAIVGQDFEHFFIQQGHSTAQIAHLTGQAKHLIAKDNSSVHSDCARLAAQDQDAVRIIAHLQLLLRRLGFLDRAYKQKLYQMDNNIVNYISFLERDSKFNLLPLYASKLSPERTTHVLGTILIKVVDDQERKTLAKLMKSYDLDTPTIICGIFQLASYNGLEQLKKIKDAKLATKLTHYVEAGSTRTIKIKTGFMGDDPAPSEERAITSVEWMKYMDIKSWPMTVWVVSTLYKIFLTTGKLAAARDLTKRASLSSISMAVTGMNLNIGGNVDFASDDDEDGDMNMENSAGSIDGRVQPVSPTKRRSTLRDRTSYPSAKAGNNRDELASISRVWAQLEQLVEALWALERWQDFADEIEGIRGSLAHMRTAKRELQVALTELQTAMTPLLDADFLTLPLDETEKQLLDIIRTHYIPEAILGYNSALYFAGHSLTRQYLVECMNLAQEVAQNEMLTRAFVEGGRMRELVMAFALDSQALLRANEVGGPSKPKKGKGGEGVGVEGKADVWQVTWRGMGGESAEGGD